MTDEIIQDLKQFISVTVYQGVNGLRQDMNSLEQNLRQDMSSLEQRLSGQILDLSSSVADAIDNTNTEVDTQLKDHEKRIGKLERKAA